MIPFDITKMHVKQVWLKSCTTALGGSITVVDKTKSTATMEAFTRIPAQFAVVRAYIKRHKISHYLKPVLTAVTFYDDHVISMESHPRGGAGEQVVDGLFGKTRWKSTCEKNIDDFVKPTTKNGNWFVDGSYVYEINDDTVRSCKAISSNGKFRTIEVRAIKFASLYMDRIREEKRTCMMFVSSKGTSVISPPVWKQTDSLVSKRRYGMKDLTVVEDEDHHPYDHVDQMMAVNLNFALKAGKEIGQLFGHDAIEPLQFDTLMCRLETVNLPNVLHEVKSTFDVNIPFTHAVAWLLGFCGRANTLDSYIAVRSLLKYLTTKGIFSRRMFEETAMFRNNLTMADVPLYTIDQAKSAISAMDPKDIESHLPAELDL